MRVDILKPVRYADCLGAPLTLWPDGEGEAALLGFIEEGITRGMVTAQPNTLGGLDVRVMVPAKPLTVQPPASGQSVPGSTREE